MTNIMYAHYMALIEDFRGVLGIPGHPNVQITCGLFGTGALRSNTNSTLK